MLHVEALPQANGIPDQGKAYAILYRSTNGVDGTSPNEVSGAVMKYATLKLPMPVFIGTGSADIDVSPDQQLALAKDACAAEAK
ncbi:hypothetical protein ACLRDC_11005 [Gluconacetobacter sacchari]|uniref:Uncharacterized protein n=2 Tax=Gluconacetobacter sacchari TaxID=92759 RepID=A0A7W4I9L1_9PROT|nr:hypothetical protein [Gluconacetobacter sacchari]MBB2158796.1 hypothetical protein [Gluconacetobacter sacchari]GBQ23981.1 hypothetical protein AA12717_1649 [Gluconacetobacter sacchari DSM 12717]